jgi:glycosyltransferase involved in cell wall biosynthesis
VNRVAIVPYLRDWSYAFTARALAKHLVDRFDISIVYQDELKRLRDPVDLVVDLWWRGSAKRKSGGQLTMKQVSSHRWTQRRSGSLNAARLVREQLIGTAGVLVPSQRLHKIISEADATRRLKLTHAPKGFHPELLGDHGLRRGRLEVGWAGAAEAVDKNVALLVKARPGIRIADRCLTQGEMGDFYNAVDVITCASDAEGDPRPLIEGMACGCFPVTVDVGIVPELVRHGENGLIVERSAQAFAEAFAWCEKNLDIVRAAGRKNAGEMARTRTWAAVAPIWGDAFDAAIARKKETVVVGQAARRAHYR